MAGSNSVMREPKEFVEAFAGFSVNEYGLGQNAVFQGVAGGVAFASDGSGASRFFRIGPVCGESFFREWHTSTLCMGAGWVDGYVVDFVAQNSCHS